MICPGDDYGQPIAPDGSATIHITALGMPSPFLCGVREYGFEYYAALQGAAQAMRLGMEGGRDPVNGVYREPVDPVDQLPSIILSTMQRMEGVTDGLLLHPMVEVLRSGPGITRREQIHDLLWHLLDEVSRDLQTGEGLCFCVDGAWSDRAVARAVNRIDAMFPDSRFREGLVGTDAA